MSKRVRSIIIGAAVLVLLVGVLLLLVLDQKPADTASSGSSSSSSEVVIYEQKPEDASIISIKNPTGEYQVARDSSGNWGIADYKGLSLDATSLSALTDNVPVIKAKELVEKDAPDLAKYGLSAPQAEIKVEFKDADKTVKEFLVGNEAPSGTEYYFAMKGTTDVYTVPTATLSCCLHEQSYYLSKVVMEAYDDNNPTTIKELKVARKDWQKPMVLTLEETKADASSSSSAVNLAAASHAMTSPVNGYLDTSKADPLLKGMFGLTASTTVKAHPTAEDIAAAGLNDPTATIDMTCDKGSYELIIGGKVPADANVSSSSESTATAYYGMLKGTDILFTFTEDTLPWLTVQPTDIMLKIVVSPYIYDVDYVTVKSDGKEYKFDINGDKDKPEFKYNDKVMEESLFRSFYQYLISAPGEEINYDAPTGEPVASIEYKYKDTAKGSELVQFYKVDSRKMIVSINGNASFKARSSYLDRLVENLQNIQDGKEIQMGW